jgi:hypothetical protein
MIGETMNTGANAQSTLADELAVIKHALRLQRLNVDFAATAKYHMARHAETMLQDIPGPRLTITSEVDIYTVAAAICLALLNPPSLMPTQQETLCKTSEERRIYKILTRRVAVIAGIFLQHKRPPKSLPTEDFRKSFWGLKARTGYDLLPQLIAVAFEASLCYAIRKAADAPQVIRIPVKVSPGIFSHEFIVRFRINGMTYNMMIEKEAIRISTNHLTAHVLECHTNSLLIRLPAPTVTTGPKIMVSRNLVFTLTEKEDDVTKPVLCLETEPLETNQSHG